MSKLMILTILMAMAMTLAIRDAAANDADVYDVSLQNYRGSATPKTVDVQFSLNQKNVFPVGLADGNSATYNDRLWVFVKYFDTAWAANTAWKHATLVLGGSIGTFSGGVGITSDGKGAFCQTGVNQTLRWAVGTDETVDGTQTFKVRVYAIEVVLIPTGAFWVGSGGSEFGRLKDKDDDGPALISTTANVIYCVATDFDDAQLEGAGILVDGDGGIDKDGTTAVDNADFPTGYKAFYIMKYEISQGQYTDFLNALTREQQSNTSGTARTALILASNATNSSLIYAMYDDDILTDRNTISCSTVSANIPITFSTTTPARACNYLCWADLCAYADWTGLRPMTELEFEKACRGRKSASDVATDNVVANEYAWGDTTLFATAYTLSNDGTAQEAASNQSTNLGNCSYDVTDGSLDGPLRCGIFAASSTSRQTSGASYYGVMELSGNVWERCVTLGEGTIARLFTGTHGNGLLAANGNATGTEVSTWPGYNSGSGEVTTASASGSGWRGGGWSDAVDCIPVSNRNVAAQAYTPRYNGGGGRCVRTSP